MKIWPHMYRYLWTMKNGFNFGTYSVLNHEDSKTLQYYNNSGDSTTTPPVFTADRKQTNANNEQVNHNLSISKVCGLRLLLFIHAWFSAVHLVHYPSQYSYFITFLEASPLYRWHTTLLLFLSICFRLQHCSALAFSSTDIFVDDCLSFKLSIPLKQNFFSLDFHNNLPK